jgi:hypothetical protein
MITLTRKQREALEKVFNRGPIYSYRKDIEEAQGIKPTRLNYKQFRRTVVQGHCGSVMVCWGRMWLVIERNGYIHS